MQDDPKMDYGPDLGLASLDLQLSHHSNERKVWRSLQFPRIRTYEWPEGKTILVAQTNKTIGLFSSNSKLQTCRRNETK